MATGERQYRDAYISMGKQNGKSVLIGGMPLYHLCCEVDMENSKPLKALGAAAAIKQAGIVYESAVQFVKAEPRLQSILKVLESTHRIVRRDGAGWYAVVSGDGDLSDGFNPSLAIVDELHRWTAKKAQTLYVALTKGRIARQQPLMVNITTAGEEHESVLWNTQFEHAQMVQQGAVEDRRLYVAIWQADQKRILNEPDYWTSREARVAANPSHEDHGGFLKDDMIEAEARKGVADPIAKRNYIRFHLNVRPSSSEEGVIDMDQWRNCGGDVDLRQWPTYDVDLLIRKWNLLDRPCYAGIDLSWTTDLTAVDLLFPPGEDGEPWSLVCFGFMARERIRERAERDRVEYDKWADAGFIEATPGKSVGYEYVKKRVRWAKELFDLKDVCFDPWNAREICNQLTDEGFSCVEIGQNFNHLTLPVKRLMALYTENPPQIRHGNNPVLNFCASSLALKSDGNDNCRPSKPDRSKSTKRIDLMAAAITAGARAFVVVDKMSVYKKRGLRSISV